MGAGRIVLGVVAAVIGLSGIVLVVIGAVLLSLQTGGFLTSERGSARTPTAALVSEPVDVELDDVPGVVRDRLGTLRIRAEREGAGPRPFLGVGPAEQVRAYLAGVATAQVTDVRFDPLVVSTRPSAGTRVRPAGPPGAQDFWVARGEGAGEQTLEWEISDGDWLVVAMNADGSRGVALVGDVGLSLPLLRTAGITLLVVGIVIDALAFVALMLIVVRRRKGRRPPGPGMGVGDEVPKVVSDF